MPNRTDLYMPQLSPRVQRLTELKFDMIEVQQKISITHNPVDKAALEARYQAIKNSLATLSRAS